MNIVEAMRDPKLFGQTFCDDESWAAWTVVLKALFAIPMVKGEGPVYSSLTGRDEPPTIPVDEAWLIVGRRGGKSFIVSLIAVYLATFRDYSQYLSPGERGTVMVLAADRKQARVIMRYVQGLIAEVPMLVAMVESESREAIELTNDITIEVHTASYRSVRGYTVVAALCDEIAFWRDESSANPDVEILDAIRPAMSTIPGAILIGLGTPYRRGGAMWDAHNEHYGRDGDSVLVVQAETRMMNPALPQKVVDKAYMRDPQAASAEYGAQFRSDVGAFLDPQWLDVAVVSNRLELPPREGVSYAAFVDPSGGRGDAFTLGIAHEEEGRRVLDLIRIVKPPFDPSSVVAEYCQTLSEYGLNEVTGDHYAGEWVVESFSSHKIFYNSSDRSKSEIYLESLPLFATGVIELPDNQILIAELRRLERRTRSGGRDTVDHPPRGHDDAANSACGALLLAADTDVKITPEMYLMGSRLTSADFPESSAGQFDRWQ
jgi:hypothetical protein